jgi:hypothetical protein
VGLIGSCGPAHSSTLAQISKRVPVGDLYLPIYPNSALELLKRRVSRRHLENSRIQDRQDGARAASQEPGRALCPVARTIEDSNFMTSMRSHFARRGETIDQAVWAERPGTSWSR